MKYHESTKTVASLYPQNAQPLDVKGFFTNVADMINVEDNDPLSYYEEMLGRNASTGEIYRWVESTVGLISGGFTYPTPYEHDGVVYSGKTFNFVPVGNRILIYEVGETFPPTENYPKGTIAFRQFMVEADTFTGVYRKTNNVAPGTWDLEFQFAEMISDAYLQAIVIAMFAGSGSADTISRSDHDHGGLLYRGIIESHIDMDLLRTPGIYLVSSGGDLPINFPVVADFGVTSFSSSDSFVVEVHDTENTLGYVYLQTIRFLRNMRTACREGHIAGPLINWSSYMTYKTQGSWTTITKSSFLHSWDGTSIKYRELSNGMIHLKITGLDGASADSTHIYTLPAEYIPTSSQNFVIQCSGGAADTGNLTIAVTSGEIHLSSGEDEIGTYNGDVYYTLD